MRRMKRKPPKMTIRLDPGVWAFVSTVMEKTGWSANKAVEKLLRTVGLVIDNDPNTCQGFVNEMQAAINLHATEVKRNADVAKARTAAYLASRKAAKEGEKLPAAVAGVERTRPALVKSLQLDKAKLPEVKKA